MLNGQTIEIHVSTLQSLHPPLSFSMEDEVTLCIRPAHQPCKFWLPCHPSWVASTAMAVSICNLFRTLPGSNCAITLGVEGCLLEMTQIAFEGVGLLGKIAREDGNKKSLLRATSFHEGIKALQPETKLESLNVACANLHPNQPNPIKSISGALNPSPRKLGGLQSHFVQRKTRAVAPNQGHQGHCSREPHTSDHASQSNSAKVPSHLRPLQARSREHISWSVHKMVGCDLTPKKPTNLRHNLGDFLEAATGCTVGFTSSTDTMTVSPSDPVTPIVTNSPDTFHHHPMLPVKPLGVFFCVFST